MGTEEKSRNPKSSYLVIGIYLQTKFMTHSVHG
jgi:hypothetical protein